MPPLVTVISAACNQGNWVRETIPRMRESLGDWPHEIIIVDDQSIDGCCTGLDKDVLIIRTETRHGVSASRRLAVRNASGDIFLFSDPHCHYPDHALRDLVACAADKQAICLPPTTSLPTVRRVRYGGFLDPSERGLKISYGRGQPAKWPALLGTIYCMQRGVYEHLGGWPEMPGVWGYSEQALSLMAWFSGVPIYVDPRHVCNHQDYHPKDAKGSQHFTYRVKMLDTSFNGHWIHAGYFPQTYETEWAPVLKRKYKDNPGYWACLNNHGWESKDPGVGRRTLKAFRTEIALRAVRSESDFYREVLKKPFPIKAEVPISAPPEAPATEPKEPDPQPEPEVPVLDPPLSDPAFVAQQAKRSKPSADEVVSRRQDRALRWFAENRPGCRNQGIRGLRVLDLGTRSGYVVQQLEKTYGARSKGIELVPETAEHARTVLKRNVETGDIRHIPNEPDNYWHMVTCIHTLEHLYDPESALKELFRVLMPSGWFLLVVPVEKEPSGRYAHNYAFPDEKTLIDMVKKFPAQKIKTEVKGLAPKPNQEILLIGQKIDNRPRDQRGTRRRR